MGLQTNTQRRKRRPKLRAIETRRLTFRVNEPLERHGVPRANQYALGGDEYGVPPDRYNSFVGAMKRSGFVVQTVWDIYNDLPYISYQRVSGGFWFPHPEDDPERWYYISPVTRRWRRIPNQRKRLAVRNGWALCHFPEGQRWPEFYYLEHGRSLEECKTRGDVAIKQGYAGVIGTQSVPFWEDEEHIFVLWPGYVLPKEHERFLTRHLSPYAKPLETALGEIWLWRVADRKLIEKSLRGLHLELHPWSPLDDWIPTLATILTRSYGQLLKKKSNLPLFQSIIRRRAWDEVEDEPLRQLLFRLGEAEYKGDATAYRLLRFLSEKLPVCIEWRTYPDQEMFAFALESSQVEYQGKDTGNRYYRLVLPELEVVTGWQTRIVQDWKGEKRQAAVISHWRVLPFLGRMRTSGATEVVVARATSNEVNQIGRAIVGIPRVEWELADVACMDAFSIDLDPGHWRGHHDLVRYFMGYGEVVRCNPVECDTPSLLMRDMLGFEFILEVSGLVPNEIPDPGDWARFIARSSLIEHDMVAMPRFTLVAPHQFTLVTKVEALRMTLLAAVKYHFGITVKEMSDFLADTPLNGLADKALAKLASQGDAVEAKQRYFYRYTNSTADQVREYAATREGDCLPLPFHLIIGILHPLWTRASYLRGEDDWMLQPPHRPPGIIVLEQDEVELINSATKLLEDEGAIYVSGIGFKRSKATGRVVDTIVRRFGEGILLVRRCDGVHKDEKGMEHPQRQYIVLYPLAMLKGRYN
jgi:hypothetical protein